MNKILLILISLLLLTPETKATHIVGGELNYLYLGNNNYEIRLTVYRDCWNGVPPFDNPAALGIFDVNNVLLQSVFMNFIDLDTLSLGPCPSPFSACYERTTYIDTINLPPITGGYQLAYQRCCRSTSLLNISNPSNIGATYYASIPDTNIFGINSNPIFNNLPSPLIYSQNSFTFNHSATDPDGDSLYYELSQPFEGGTMANPLPQPPNNPPYTTIVWNPPYSTIDMLGGTVPLTINPSTGLLIGTPGPLGRYAVGIKVSEYRSGIKISETRRDIDYIVSNSYSLINTVSISGDTLISDQSFASYQWLDCNNGYAVIPGAINQSYIPTANGNYAVEITNCSGIDTSGCINFFLTGITESNNIIFSISPNPVKNVLNINAKNIIKIKIIDIAGKTVKSFTQSKKTINVGDLSQGIYFLQIESNKGISTNKFVKE